MFIFIALANQRLGNVEGVYEIEFQTLIVYKLRYKSSQVNNITGYFVELTSPDHHCPWFAKTVTLGITLSLSFSLHILEYCSLL